MTSKRPLQNRVLATGEIVAHPARGNFMGNRGILHDTNQVLGRARWKHKAWVTCRLVWKNWHRDVMQPGAYTELFFHDEAVAMAAGHRPCALCRRSDFNDYRAAAGITDPTPKMDAVLHNDRAIARRFEQRRQAGRIEHLPNGAVYLDGTPWLVFDEAVYPIDVTGYGSPQPRKEGSVQVLTPKLTLSALAGGYKPKIIGLG